MYEVVRVYRNKYAIVNTITNKRMSKKRVFRFIAMRDLKKLLKGKR